MTSSLGQNGDKKYVNLSLELSISQTMLDLESMDVKQNNCCLSVIYLVLETHSIVNIITAGVIYK